MAHIAKTVLFSLLVSVLLVSGCETTGQGTSRQGTYRSPVIDKTAQERKEELKELLSSRFVDSKLHLELAVIYLDEQNWEEAKYHYSTAISFDPVCWPAQAGLVKIQKLQGRNAQANAAAEVYMNQVAASAKKSLKLAMAFDQHKLDEQALACYQQALLLDPEFPEIHRQIGYFYLERGDKAQAEKYFVESFNLNPFQPDVAEQLGQLGVTIESPQTAIDEDMLLDENGNVIEKGNSSK
ncbi:MAG: tetratricopeptide repeat protein [Planctomycetota bacterium]|jgi:tetratricopeptide (TPR) repeat protein